MQLIQIHICFFLVFSFRASHNAHGKDNHFHAKAPYPICFFIFTFCGLEGGINESEQFCVSLQRRNKNNKTMKTLLLVVGRTVESHYITAINDYVQRTKHFISFDMEVIPELKTTKSLSEEQQKEKEGELILKSLQGGDVVVLLDEFGKEFRSVEFARWMEKKLTTVNKRLVFIIGGPYGFSQKVYDAAQEKISLSKMTFSHQMVRLIFVEQLYRAMTILNGGPYHHE
jgi:23S rRNA (pseudouridine1915-N3)-methyltransferase